MTAAGPLPSVSRPNLAASAIVALRERRLSLRAPPEQPRHLAFGRGFLVQATATEVVIHDSADSKILARLALAARAVMSLPAGSVLVVAHDAAYRIDPGQTKAQRLNRIWLLPGALLLPNLTTQNKLWVVHPALKKAQRHAFDLQTPLGIEAERPLEDHDGRAIAVLSDGDLLYSAGRELVRDPGFGRPRRFRLPEELQHVWRLAAADRIDRTWVATPEGAILLLELGERPRVVRRIDSGLVPIDFVAARSLLALVGAREHDDKPREFVVSVFAPDGKRLFSDVLPPAEVTADPDWAAKVLRDREIVASDNPMRVAAGGPTLLQLIDAKLGTRLPGSESAR